MTYLSFILFVISYAKLSIQNKTKLLDNNTRIVIKYNNSYNYFRFFFQII